MFEFLKRLGKKDKEVTEKEPNLEEKGNGLDSSDEDNIKESNNDFSNEEFNKFNEVNKENDEFNKFNEANANNSDNETKKIKETVADKSEKEQQTNQDQVEENNKAGIKSGRFIDLAGSKNEEKKENKSEEAIEKKSLEVEDNSEQLNEEEISSDHLEEEVTEKESIFDKLKKGLSKTRDSFTSSLINLFTRNVKIDDDLYDELEEILISADIGMNSTIEIVDELREEIKKRKIKESDKIYPVLKDIMIKKLDQNNLDNKIKVEDGKLTVILVIGVNGVGKTTTIGKLANNFKKEGKSVMLAAADTFRAAAIDQLGEWANRADVELIKHQEGADPSAVIFDAIKSARSKDTDVLICDTAGRLHNKKNLMQELDKINRTIDTHAVDSNRENLLVLDATTGQNAVNQLKEFKNVTDITGLILTKLDGTAKGGVIFPLQVEVEVPVKYIGVGEGIDHLQKFDSESFVEAMF